MYVPTYLFLTYGFVETFAILWFTCVFSNITTNHKTLFLITAIKLAITYFIRNMFPDFLIISMTSVLSGIILIYLFTRIINIRLVIFSFISVGITIIFSPLSILIFDKLIDNWGQNTVWVVSGLPHILILVLVTIAFKEWKIKYEGGEYIQKRFY